MIPPSLLAQLVGWPPVACALCTLYAFLLYLSFKRPVDFFLFGALAVVGARFTYSSYDQRRRYKLYQADMALMRMQAGAVELPKESVWWAVAAGGLALVVMVFASSCLSLLPPGHAGVVMVLDGVWWLSLLYVAGTAGKLLLGLYRYLTSSKADTEAIVEPAGPESKPVVTWTLERAAASPSRAVIESDLPDYCAAMMARSNPKPS